MPFRSCLLIFVCALLVRAAGGGVLFLWFGESGFLISDSFDYLDHAASGRDQTQFMPIYLLFLSAHMSVFGSSVVWPILSQIIIDSATCVVVARLAADLDQGLGIPAGLFAVVNPVQIVMATLVLTETLFVFACALALWATVRWLRSPNWSTAGAIGLAIGFGISVRAMLLPWALVLPAVLVIAAVLAGRFSRGLVGQAVFATLLALVIQTPVMLSNHDRYGGWGLTTQSGAYALLWLVPLVLEAKDGTPHADGARMMNQRFADLTDPAALSNPFDHSRAMSRAALGVLHELGPVPIANPGRCRLSHSRSRPLRAGSCAPQYS